MQPKDLHGGLAFFFEQDHRDCDARWADVEEWLDTEDIEMAQSAWRKYEASMRRHLAMEEEVLIPAIIARSGVADSEPVLAVQMEHRKMLGLLGQIGEAVEAGDAEQAMELGDTLLMLVQRHNANEEDILYPLAEELLASDWEELLGQLDEYEPESGR